MNTNARSVGNLAMEPISADVELRGFLMTVNVMIDIIISAEDRMETGTVVEISIETTEEEGPTSVITTRIRRTRNNANRDARINLYL